MNIDHIAIWTENLEAEKDFYLRYFDCAADKKYDNRAKRFSSYFITFAGGSRIELHIAINVKSRENVNKLTEEFERDGLTVVSRPRITGDGYYESVVLDPEKNVIEIMSR
jgi:lactoylglutathione lyase